MIKHLKRPDAATIFNPELSQDEVKGACNSLREKTTACPDGCHFGHFIVIGEDNFLNSYLTKLISLPLILGISPYQYRYITACFLQKKPDEYRMNKMRTIWLQDAFFSITQRVLARRTESQANKLGLLAIKDYGGRKGKCAVMKATNIRMTMDLVLQKKECAVIRGIDYSNCFDRVNHVMAILKLRQIGHRSGPLYCRFATIHNLVVTIRTAFRDTELIGDSDVYAVPLDQPFQGTLQGGADSMSNWAVVSSHIIDSMRREGHGVAFKCCISGEVIRYVGCHYVDDATQIDMPMGDNLHQLMEASQRALDDLEGFAKATGQCINTKKSYWWLINFEWTNGKSRLQRMGEYEPELTTKDKHGTVQVLPRVEYDEAKEILGLWMSPQDDSKAMTKKLKDKVLKWVDGMKQSKMSASQAWIALTTRILKGVEWPLVASMLSETQCKSIISPLLKAGLRESRIQWRIHRDILYLSMGTMGMQFPYIYTTMGIRKISFLVDNG